MTTAERERIKALERENRQPRQVNEILKRQRLLLLIRYITRTEAEEAFYANMNTLDEVA